MSILPSPFPGKKNPKKEGKIASNATRSKVPGVPPPAVEPDEVTAEKGVGAVKKEVKRAKEEKQEKKEKLFKKRQAGTRLKLPFPYFHLSIAFIFSLLFLGGIIFASDKLTSLSQEAEQSRSQLVALRELELSLKKLSQDLQSVEKEMVVINQALPNEETIIQFVKEFRAIGQDASIETFNFETDQPKKDKAGNFYIGFNVKLKGSFAVVKNFLISLVKLPYLVKLDLVDIEKAGEEEAQMILRAKIFVADSFFQPEED